MNAHRRATFSRVYCLLVLLPGAFSVQGQVNSWTNGASAGWEQQYWSLGTLPGANQTVTITNSGWKAVMISGATAASYPQTLTVSSIILSSPTNSFNTLLLNYAGVGNPLVTGSLSIASNTAVTLLSSALAINGPAGIGMSVGGAFTEDDSSIVSGGQMDIGYNGAGIYNLNSGTLTVTNIWIGGSFGGVFNQTGGWITEGTIHLDGGTYNLTNGTFADDVYFNGGTFHQAGGLCETNFALFSGRYILDGGIHHGNIVLPTPNAYSSGFATALQSGGTNLGDLNVGSHGYGVYTMSNGVVIANSVTIGGQGSMVQWDGRQEIAGAFSTEEAFVNRGEIALGAFTLQSGIVTAASMMLAGYYYQYGGTNTLAGDLTLNGTHGGISLFNGRLTENNATISPSWSGGFLQAGGVHVVTNTLTVAGSSILPMWQGFSVTGGDLWVSNVILTAAARFQRTGGTIHQSGQLTLLNATLQPGPGPSQFGPLQLGVAAGTNSTLSLSASNCTVRFGASASLAWSNNAVLTIENWSGSLYGGGHHQVFFGTNTGSLSSTQLSRIQFADPAGLTGTFPARLLADGEIVPDTGTPLPLQVGLQTGNGLVQLNVQGNIGSSYSIEVSTDLLHWAVWTNEPNTTGTISITDPAVTNFPRRFYRARLMP
jgi:hypothetical protein